MKEILFAIHMYGSARVENESEIQNIGCKVEFDKVNAEVGTIEVDINSVGDIDESGNAAHPKLMITNKIHAN